MPASPELIWPSAVPTRSSEQVKGIEKEVDITKLRQQTQNRIPVTGEELEAISAAANSAAVWALQNLSANNMSDFTPDSGYMLRVSPCHSQQGPARSVSSTKPPSILLGDWMGYSPSTSPQPSMATLSPRHYDTIPEKHLIRTDTHTKRMYICIPGGAGSSSSSSKTESTANCDHCICIEGSVRPSLHGVNPLAPKALCHFHSFYMTTGKTLTRCEQLALGQLDSDGVSWTPQQTAVFVALLKRRLGRLALLYDSEELPSLTAAQSRVVGMDYGAIGDGRSMVKKSRPGADLEDDEDDEHVGGVVAGGLDPTDDDVFT